MPRPRPLRFVRSNRPHVRKLRRHGKKFDTADEEASRRAHAGYETAEGLVRQASGRNRRCHIHGGVAYGIVRRHVAQES